MKAIVCKAFGPVTDLVYREVADPVPGPGEVLLKNLAAGVNFPDALLVEGNYQMKPELPFVPGFECAGVIEAIGAGVESFRVGQRVMCFTNIGAFAEKVVANQQQVSPLPDFIPETEGANLLCAHGTAHHALKQRGQLKAGETLVVLGAAGGTGMAAVQIGKAMGARVIAVCSTDEKLQFARDNGADELIKYPGADLKQAIRELTDGRGADVVYDAVGGDAFNACSRAMARNGRLLVVGFASGEIPSFPVNLALVKEYSLVGVFWGNFTKAEPQVFAENMQELFDWYQQGAVRVQIDQQFPLTEAVAAMQKVQQRKVQGKVVLVP